MSIDNILYINLDKDVTRRENIEKNLNLFNLKYTRISGVYCDKRNVGGNVKSGEVKGKIDDIKYDFKGVMKTCSRVGCILAHIKALIYAKKMSGITMILEDDISLELIKNFNETFDNIIKDAPDNWSIIKVHCNNSSVVNNLFRKYKKGEKYSLLTKKNVINHSSAGCYILNKKGIDSLFKKYYNSDKNEWIINEDYVLADIALFYIDNVYTFNYPICLNYITNSNNYIGVNKAEIKSNNVIKNIHGITNK